MPIWQVLSSSSSCGSVNACSNPSLALSITWATSNSFNQLHKYKTKTSEQYFADLHHRNQMRRDLVKTTRARKRPQMTTRFMRIYPQVGTKIAPHWDGW